MTIMFFQRDCGGGVDGAEADGDALDMVGVLVSDAVLDMFCGNGMDERGVGRRTSRLTPAYLYRSAFFEL